MPSKLEEVRRREQERVRQRAIAAAAVVSMSPASSDSEDPPPAKPAKKATKKPKKEKKAKKKRSTTRSPGKKRRSKAVEVEDDVEDDDVDVPPRRRKRVRTRGGDVSPVPAPAPVPVPVAAPPTRPPRRPRHRFDLPPVPNHDPIPLPPAPTPVSHVAFNSNVVGGSGLRRRGQFTSVRNRPPTPLPSSRVFFSGDADDVEDEDAEEDTGDGGYGLPHPPPVSSPPPGPAYSPSHSPRPIVRSPDVAPLRPRKTMADRLFMSVGLLAAVLVVVVCMSFFRISLDPAVSRAMREQSSVQAAKLHMRHVLRVRAAQYVCQDVWPSAKEPHRVSSRTLSIPDLKAAVVPLLSDPDVDSAAAVRQAWDELERSGELTVAIGTDVTQAPVGDELYPINCALRLWVAHNILLVLTFVVALGFFLRAAYRRHRLKHDRAMVALMVHEVRSCLIQQADTHPDTNKRHLAVDMLRDSFVSQVSGSMREYVLRLWPQVCRQVQADRRIAQTELHDELHGQHTVWSWVHNHAFAPPPADYDPEFTSPFAHSLSGGRDVTTPSMPRPVGQSTPPSATAMLLNTPSKTLAVEGDGTPAQPLQPGPVSRTPAGVAF